MIEVINNMEKLNITQIRELLQTHNYLADKNVLPSEIKTGRTYKFMCMHGHLFESTVSNVFQSGKFSCPICSGRRVLKGFNDLWTTHPNIAMRLKHKEDGYKYSAGSNVKLSWVCPDCGHEKIATPNKMSAQTYFCDVCGHDASYPEKFVSNLLRQFGIHFEREQIFEWSNGKRYDFYLPQYDCIIETHGKQHYTNSDFSYLGGKTYIEEQYNDSDKLFYAKEYGKIENYIVLDCRKSEMRWIKHSLLESGLLDILCIIPDTVDWDECHTFAMSNLTKEICQMYENGVGIHALCEEFNLCRNSIITKLKQGSQIGWCSYNPKHVIEQTRQENGKRIVDTMSKPVIQIDKSDKIIAEFPSIQDAQRTLSIYHIWDCIVGKRQSAGGCKWRYKYDN
jgi:predicted RNA-binding Zn-ribbon protein involved in translation (DUF1610 family)